jgi:aminoglycoside phosphotransferase (APT) family kinase protein
MDGELLKRIALENNDCIDDNTVVSKGAYSTVYITDQYVYKVASKNLKSDYQKEGTILQFLAKNPFLNDRIPRLVSIQEVDDIVIEVQTKVFGVHKSALTVKNYAEIGLFLRYLHESYSSDTMHEFDGKAYPTLTKYIEEKLPSYEQALIAKVNVAEDLALIQRAVATISENIRLIVQDKIYNIVHKDLSLDNMLFSKLGFSGVIDFGAAQLGIPEWDFAIIMQRFNMTKQDKTALFKGYSKKISLQKVALLGILQSLRFWKSHVDAEEFVKQQKKFLESCMSVLKR